MDSMSAAAEMGGARGAMEGIAAGIQATSDALSNIPVVGCLISTIGSKVAGIFKSVGDAIGNEITPAEKLAINST